MIPCRTLSGLSRRRLETKFNIDGDCVQDGQGARLASLKCRVELRVEIGVHTIVLSATKLVLIAGGIIQLTLRDISSEWFGWDDWFAYQIRISVTTRT